MPLAVAAHQEISSGLCRDGNVAARVLAAAIRVASSMVGSRAAIPGRALWLALLVLLGLVTGCESREEREGQHFERGVALFEAGSLEKSALEFRNVLKLNPKNAQALFYIGQIHERAQRFSQAAAAFQQAAAEQPSFVEAQIKVGSYGLLNGDLDMAARAARAVLLVDQSNPDGLTLEGAVALQQGRAQEAIRMARAALEHAPSDPDAVLLLARALAASGAIDEAVGRLDAAAVDSAAPESVLYRRTKIELLEAAGRDQEVVQEYERLIGLEPETPQHRLDLATLQSRRGDLAAAEKVLREAIASGVAGPQPTASSEAVEALVRVVHRRHGLAEAVAEFDRLVATQVDGAAELRFVLVELLVREEQYPRAEQVLRELIDEDDKAAGRARAVLAQVKIAEGELDSAEQLAKEVLESQAGSREATLILGQVANRRGQHDEAVRMARSTLQQNPQWVPGLKLAAEAHLAKGEQELAIAVLAEIVGLAPFELGPSQLLATLLAEQGDYAASLKAWDHVVRITDTPQSALQARAQVAIRQGDWSAAEADIKQLLIMPQEDGDATLLAGNLLVARGRPEEAREWFKRAQVEQPDAVAPTLGLVRSFLAQSDVEGALDYLQRRVAERPDDAVAYGLQGYVFAQERRLQEAADALRGAIRADPDEITYYRQLGRILHQQGAPDQAVPLLEEGLQHAPAAPDLLNDLAVSYAFAQDYDQAIATYEKLLEIQPDLDPAANNYAALIADHRGGDPKALEQALAVAERFQTSSNPDYLDTLGWLHYRKGDDSFALTFFERAIALGGSGPQFHYHRGMTLQRLGELERAAADLAKAVADDVDYTGRDEARATLQALQARLARSEQAG